MRLICTENKNKKAESAAYLLKKYAKNLDGDATLAVFFCEDKSCIGDGYRFERSGENIFVFGNTAVAFNVAVQDVPCTPTTWPQALLPTA